MNRSQEARLGALGLQAYFQLPPLPSIVAEWAALIPLVVHLASAQDDFHMVGQVCLRGRFRLSLLPRLGHSKGIARIMSQGLQVLDETSSKGAGAMTVWDVAWSSVFSCANGAARDLVTEHMLRKSDGIVIDVEKHERIDMGVRSSINERASKLESTTSETSSKETGFRRPQILHILRLDFDQSPRSTSHNLLAGLSNAWTEVFCHIVLLGVVIIMIMGGAYGSAAIIFSCTISQVVCNMLPMIRPMGYLKSNEASSNACMLAANHENACTWYLHIGDRAIVDWLLNKSLVDVNLPRGRALSRYFIMSHYLQLLAMTYVAAQKGWDGVCLFGLMLVSWILDWLFSQHNPASRWIAAEGLKCRSKSFRLTGRTPMLGAVQMISTSLSASNFGPVKFSWMDDVIAARREGMPGYTICLDWPRGRRLTRVCRMSNALNGTSVG